MNYIWIGIGLHKIFHLIVPSSAPQSVRSVMAVGSCVYLSTPFEKTIKSLRVAHMKASVFFFMDNTRY